MTMGKGPYTGCDLGDVTPLCMPWREEHHHLRPVFSRPAALLSLELASTAYDMQTSLWRENGWHDISYLVDKKLFTGPAVNGQTAEGSSEALADHYQRAAASLVHRQNPISLVRGTLRQRESSDTCKCVVMAHPAGPGRFVIAIGFMGTGRRIYDWFSNFRMEREEGMHRGFLQLTQEFESQCSAILFPETARQLGLPSLTLADILQACRRPGSPFRIWTAGHSQGGALMQLFALREISRGLLRQNLIGYGFASPSVAYENPGWDYGSFPLFHIINGDDVTPRVGAKLHIGRCMVYQPDAAMRAACYGSALSAPGFRDALRLLALIQGSQGGLMFTMALLQVLEALPDPDASAILGRIAGSLLPDRMLSALGSRTDQFLRFLTRRVEMTYARVTEGGEIPADLIRLYRDRIAALIRRYGPQPFIRALLEAMAVPHRLRDDGKRTEGAAAYQAIVTRHFSALKAYPNSAAVPRSAGHPLRGGKAAPACRYRRYSRRRNQRTVR